MSKPTDVFMQFTGIDGATHLTDATELMEFILQTGLSVRGQFAWLVHLVEVICKLPVYHAQYIDWCLSTVQGQAVMPELNDHGCIAKGRMELHMITSGSVIVPQPQRLQFLPPIPVASSRISLYVYASIDDASIRGKPVILRLGYTTIALEPKVYLEIAETWAEV